MWSVYLVIILDTLFLRPSIHFNPLHSTFFPISHITKSSVTVLFHAKRRDGLGVIQTYSAAILQLSYADTHPMFTKQHFPNFFRVVPSENAFNAPRLKLLQEFNWTRVGTIYQNEPRYSLVSCDIVAV